MDRARRIFLKAAATFCAAPAAVLGSKAPNTYLGVEIVNEPHLAPLPDPDLVVWLVAMRQEMLDEMVLSFEEECWSEPMGSDYHSDPTGILHFSQNRET